MATELVLLGTAGGPMPVSGRAGVSSAVVVDDRVYLVDCGRGSASGYGENGLRFPSLAAIFLTHLHFDHVGDLPGMLIYPWGVRTNPAGSVPPIGVYGPGRLSSLPDGDDEFSRHTVIARENPAPGTEDLVGKILEAFAYHLNVMPLDTVMPDAGNLVRGHDVHVVDEGAPVTVFEDVLVRVTATQVTHGHAHPALAYRFESADGSIVFSGDTTASENLIALASGADVLVHQVADLDWLERHGTTGRALERMAGLHTAVTQVGKVASRAGVGTLILNHYLPADPAAISEDEWREKARVDFAGEVIAGRDGLRFAVGRPGLSNAPPAA
jgi:ribonuclease BN (tRNA processing enzyme)